MRRPLPPARTPGLTLVELVIAMAVLAVLATLALPTFGSLLDRHRLTAAAETLALDMAQARFQAAQTGQPLHVVFRTGARWCWAVSRTPDCDCDAPAGACALKTVVADEMPGVVVAAASAARFDADPSPGAGGAVLHTRGSAEELRVQLSPLGRARICTATGLRGYAAC